MTDSTSLSLDEQRARIEKLTQLVAERVRAESGMRASRDARESTLAAQWSADRQRLIARQQAERGSQQSQQSSRLAEIVRAFETELESAKSDHDQEFRRITLEIERRVAAARVEWEKTQAGYKSDVTAAVQNLQQGLREFKERIEERRQELRELETAAMRVLKRRRCWRSASAEPEVKGICDPNAPLDTFPRELAAAHESVKEFSRQIAPKFLAPSIQLAILISIWIAGATVGVWLDRLHWPWFGASGTLALGTLAIIRVIVRPILVRQTLETNSRFRQAIANADVALDAAITLRAADADTRKIQGQQQCDQQIRRATVEHQSRVEAIHADRETLLREAADQFQVRRKAAAEARDAKQREAHQQFSKDNQILQQSHADQLRESDGRQQADLSATQEMHQRAWQRLVTRWRDGIHEFHEAVEQMWAYCDEHFPSWEDFSTALLDRPPESLPAIRFGKYAFSLRGMEGGMPEDEDLQPERSDFVLPALMSFGSRPSLLYEATGEGRPVAVRSMVNVMLRLLTSLPPGKVRFTIIDPVGLGQNFSAFMHLTDYDEKLIHHRIWTEAPHILQRLSDLTEHMEDVIQTYLRNEFASIEDYNRQAGEVAEPFQVLVVANFPAGFTEESAQRLLSIMHTGARCGVLTLISTDSKLEFPRNFDLSELESAAETLQWNGQRFMWHDEPMKDFPLMLDDPPEGEKLTQLMREIGVRAKSAARVEVPFATVAGPEDSWWSLDSRAGIDVALGRAGASKLQFLRLGKGTSQHVLISGKTGSGKSTLLHALITNTALHYSPDEVEFYLIDFKKGVEFKPYASRRLPHARVIAIESEREFGMSVLERLDAELRIRGDLFREAGVQDVRNYRDQHPDRRLPRILLIIDEFQEFFTQDDRVAQEAALLLDRLVRQGRAFGVHVLLGSQTLAGAYSLARSTLGQMAIRIALQCSEADSHLILSEDNTAARLLNRPGEAIYNDANGLFEGNHPFQVVWLSGGEQNDYLDRIAERADQNGRQVQPLIVFEGNAPADPAENASLREALASNGSPSTLPAKTWLGSPIAIKEPTAAIFRRQSGANLLVVGQQEDLALGLLATALVGLAAAAPSERAPQFFLFDGSRPESPEAEWWPRFLEKLPIETHYGQPRDAAKMLQELAGELARRSDAGRESDPPIYVMIYNLNRFRDLRRSDDDLGFGGFGEEKPPSPAQQWVSVLRDGPALGIHSLIWADTFNTVNRWLDRAALRELDQRVLFQMSANDSSNLMDSPEASRLGAHRAVLFSEEQGTHEKFRPYGPPAESFIQSIATQLDRRR